MKVNKECIALFYLPSYSPAMDQNHLEKNLIGSMRRLSKSPQRSASYFDHPAVAYAKAACVLLVNLPE
jgi:hypothetical protein